jgi:hypothetical protein
VATLGDVTQMGMFHQVNCLVVAKNLQLIYYVKFDFLDLMKTYTNMSKILRIPNLRSFFPLASVVVELLAIL